MKPTLPPDFGVQVGERPSAGKTNRWRDGVYANLPSDVQGLDRHTFPGGTVLMQRTLQTNALGGLEVACKNVDDVAIPDCAIVQVTETDTGTAGASVGVRRPLNSGINWPLAWVANGIAVGGRGRCAIGGAMIATVTAHLPALGWDAQVAPGWKARPMKLQFCLSVGSYDPHLHGGGGFPRAQRSRARFLTGSAQNRVEGPFVVLARLGHVAGLAGYKITNPQGAMTAWDWSDLCLVALRAMSWG